MTSSLQTVMNTVLFVMWMAVYHVMLKRKYNLAVTLCLETVALALYLCTPLLTEKFSMLRMAVSPVILFLPALFLYEGSVMKRLFQGFICYFIMMIMELAMALILPKGFNIDAATNTAFGFVVAFIYLFGNSVLLMVYLYISKRSRDRIEKGDWILIGVLLVAQFFLAINGASLSLKYRTESKWNTVIFLTAIAISMVCTILLMNSLSKKAEERAKNRYLTDEVDNMKRYYGFRSEQYKNFSRMRHDIANHMIAIRGLIAEGKTEEAKRYADSLSEIQNEVSGVFQCGNDAVGSFLYNRLQVMLESGIRVKTDIRMQEDAGIPDRDLVAILGNLLDNVEEGCMGITDPWLNLTVAERDGYLLIRTENSFQTEKRDKRERIAGLPRGIGTDILKELAESHQGIFETEEKDGVYTASVYLKETKNHA